MWEVDKSYTAKKSSAGSWPQHNRRKQPDTANDSFGDKSMHKHNIGFIQRLVIIKSAQLCKGKVN